MPTAKIWRRRLALSFALAINACSQAGVELPAASGAKAAVELSTSQIYTSLAALTPTAKAQLFDQVSRMSFDEFYTRAAAHLSEGPVNLDGKKIAQQAGTLAALHAAMLALGQRFPNLGALWSTLAIDPSQVSLQGLKDGASSLTGASPVAAVALELTIKESESSQCQQDKTYYQRVWNLSSDTIAAALNYQQSSGVSAVPLGGGITLKQDFKGSNGLWALQSMGFIPRSARYISSCYVEDRTSPYEKSVLVANPDGYTMHIGLPVDPDPQQQWPSE